MKKTCLLSWLTAAAFFLACSAVSASLRSNIKTEAQHIQARTGVQIHYLYNAATFFPQEWQDDETLPQANIALERVPFEVEPPPA